MKRRYNTESAWIRKIKKNEKALSEARQRALIGEEWLKNNILTNDNIAEFHSYINSRIKGGMVKEKD